MYSEQKAVPRVGELNTNSNFPANAVLSSPIEYGAVPRKFANTTLLKVASSGISAESMSNFFII